MVRSTLLKYNAVVVACCLLFFVCDKPTFSQEEVTFVSAGVAKAIQFLGPEWKTEDGTLVGSGKGSLLVGDRAISAGDFQLRARLQIDELGKSAASFMLNGDHFGFEGQLGEMFTEGRLLGTRNLGPSKVKEGIPFLFEISRAGNRLQIAIDGEVMFKTDVKVDKLTFSFRPHRSKMRIFDLTATAQFAPLPRPIPHTRLFVNGQGKYPRYRIPAIVRSNKGTLLAFCEGRTGGDSGPIDLILKRSTDDGKTWKPLQVVWDDGENTCGNPCPVVDRQTGTIWLLMTWNLGTDHEREILSGKSKDVRHVYVTHSVDDGNSWSTPKKISETTRKEHWRWYATGPGNGIQLKRGKHKGRLLIPCNHSDHSVGGHPYRSHVIYSDDHGKSWHLGGVHQDRTNESAVVERSDGAILQAMRSYHGKNRRAMAISHDGGESWGDVHLEDALDTPVCQANILRWDWPEEEGKGRILFSSPQGAARSRMTIWMSEDDGKTWPVQKLVNPGASAYSNLIVLGSGKIGLLYETGGNAISYAIVDLD